MAEEKKGIRRSGVDAVIDVRNELIVQSANLYLLVGASCSPAWKARWRSPSTETSDLMAEARGRGETAEGGHEQDHQRPCAPKAHSVKRMPPKELARRSPRRPGSSLEDSVRRFSAPECAEQSTTSTN